MIPSTIGVAAFQINVMLTQGLAFGSNDHIVAEFSYAVRLMELPQGVLAFRWRPFCCQRWPVFAVDKNFAAVPLDVPAGCRTSNFCQPLGLGVIVFIRGVPIVRAALSSMGNSTLNRTNQVSFACSALCQGWCPFRSSTFSLGHFTRWETSDPDANQHLLPGDQFDFCRDISFSCFELGPGAWESPIP